MAHRGLHGGDAPENTLAAVEAAVEAGYAVEIDLQFTADGGLIILHDPTLERTTGGEGPVAAQTLDTLRAVPIRGTDETLSSLDDALALVSGRAPLFLDLKAPRTIERKAAMTAAVQRALGRYGGATAAMTFDPDMLGLLRRALPDTPLGILSGRETPHTSMINRFGLDAMLHTPRTKPDFVAYFAQSLPNPAVRFHRRKRPVLAWTVRTEVERQRLAPHVDQIIFEGFSPTDRMSADPSSR
ncbi:glycerophosphodiester phosphodiesterase family protein [Acuticoccus sp. MNP-M23]|uniref:glycerophosphodiester phosphodiesterase family protein n=1 Tax=Acuticoccus sp. MNP-M23 TaxID=3072793 RepID=UPI002814EFE3|nr:glycerophosphodiester phosphodiesterase family protein [Acuticoccus sp. MNP-M23]WMS45148.1 glycerophosphodiester phosphodiesterase family protein [Acuticoccus sp. MNP-M23]